jgi:hypothetical protein
MIEEEGLRTRADLSGLLGPVDDFDAAAPGTFAKGKRVSGWVSRDHAATVVDEYGPGLVSWSVDPAKTLANRASVRTSSTPAAYWESARPLAAWQDEGDLPVDLEVHVNVGVRAKFVSLMSSLATAEQLGDYAPLVAAVADEDRLSAKALMHLAIIASDGDFDSPAFVAACALAWRDTPDPKSLTSELMEFGPDKIASAALAEFGTEAPEATTRLREVLETAREFADDNGLDHGQGIMGLTAMRLAEVPAG